jgi:hypothetical protein
MKLRFDVLHMLRDAPIEPKKKDHDFDFKMIENSEAQRMYHAIQRDLQAQLQRYVGMPIQETRNARAFDISRERMGVFMEDIRREYNNAMEATMRAQEAAARQQAEAVEAHARAIDLAFERQAQIAPTMLESIENEFGRLSRERLADGSIQFTQHMVLQPPVEHITITVDPHTRVNPSRGVEITHD